MPPKKCTFNLDWLQRTDSCGNKVADWATKLDDTRFKCEICIRTLCCEKNGFQAVHQHYMTAKHIENAKLKLSSSQLRLSCTPLSTSNNDNTATASSSRSILSTSTAARTCTAPITSNTRPIFLLSKKDASVRAELLWSMKCVVSSYSARSCDGIGDLFKTMDPQFPPDFSLGRTKFGYYVTEALGPHFRQIFLDDIIGSWFTVCYDETTNKEGWKELQVSVRYWSSSRREVIFHHLESFFIGRATGEVLKDNILTAVRNANLPLEKMMMLSMDGPNVNKRTFKLLSQDVKEDRGTPLLDIGTCNLHIVHNAFLKGLEQFGARVSELGNTLHSFFDVWSARREDYRRIQEETGVPEHKFMKHATSRWLSLLKVAQRLQEQWPALKSYFLKFIAQDGAKASDALKKLQSYKNICEILRDKTAEAEVSFVIDSAKLFERFSTIFQSEAPMIHLLYEEMHDLVATLMGRVCKPETLVTIGDTKEPFKSKNLLSLAEIEARCSAETRRALRDLPERDKAYFLKSVQDHFVAGASHLLQKSVLNCTDCKYFKFLKPSERTNKDCGRWAVKIARFLNIPEISESQLRDEWVLFQLDEKVPSIVHGQRIDHYWNQIFELKNTLGGVKYPKIVSLVKASLVLAQGSADVERGFSSSGRIITEDTPRLSVRTLNSKLNIKAGMRRYDYTPERVPITADLLTAAYFARSRYQEYLDEEKKKKEEQEHRKEQEEEEKRVEEEFLKKQEKARKDLGKLEGELDEKKKAVKEQKEASDKLLGEAEERLRAALKRKDFASLHVAQGVMEGAKKMREDLRGEEEKLEQLQTKVDKKKTGLLTALEKKG